MSEATISKEREVLSRPFCLFLLISSAFMPVFPSLLDISCPPKADKFDTCQPLADWIFLLFLASHSCGCPGLIALLMVVLFASRLNNLFQIYTPLLAARFLISIFLPTANALLQNSIHSNFFCKISSIIKVCHFWNFSILYYRQYLTKSRILYFCSTL